VAVLASPAFARRLTAGQRARLGACLLAAIGLHAAALLQSRMPVAAHAGSARNAVQVRLVSAEAMSTPAAAVVAEPAKPLPRPAKTATRTLKDEPASPAERVTAAVPTSAADLAPPPAAGFERDADYLPRSALTVPPRARDQVVIDYPFFDGALQRYVAEFDLFIDDSGGVVRVVGATPDLPAILADAVRQAFLAARFAPGELDGRPVRSRMRIEVTFDSRRPDAS